MVDLINCVYPSDHHWGFSLQRCSLSRTFSNQTSPSSPTFCCRVVTLKTSFALGMDPQNLLSSTICILPSSSLCRSEVERSIFWISQSSSELTSSNSAFTESQPPNYYTPSKYLEIIIWKYSVTHCIFVHLEKIIRRFRLFLLIFEQNGLRRT